MEVVSSIFRTFDLPSYSGRLLGFGCFAAGPPRGPAANRSGDGHDLGQPVHLQVALSTPLSRGNMP